MQIGRGGSMNTMTLTAIHLRNTDRHDRIGWQRSVESVWAHQGNVNCIFAFQKAPARARLTTVCVIVSVRGYGMAGLFRTTCVAGIGVLLWEVRM